MSSIAVALVDEHFMHGKVALSWCSHLDSHLVIVVNDQLVGDKTRQGLLEMTVPDEISTRFYTIDKAVDKLSTLTENKNAIVIFEDIDDLIKITDKGIEIPRIILSTLADEAGPNRTIDNLRLNNGQINSLKELERNSVVIQLCQTPEDEIISLKF